MPDGGAYAINALFKYGGRGLYELVAQPTGALSDAWNANVDEIPEYSRRLEMEFPIELGGVEYKTLADAKEPLQEIITNVMGIKFEGDVTTDGKISIHGDWFGPNAIVGDAEAQYVEIHFRDAETLNIFVENSTLVEVGSSNTEEISLDGNKMDAEGRAETTIFGFGR